MHQYAHAPHLMDLFVWSGRDLATPAYVAANSWWASFLGNLSGSQRDCRSNPRLAELFVRRRNLLGTARLFSSLSTGLSAIGAANEGLAGWNLAWLMTLVLGLFALTVSQVHQCGRLRGDAPRPELLIMSKFVLVLWLKLLVAPIQPFGVTT